MAVQDNPQPSAHLGGTSGGTICQIGGTFIDAGAPRKMPPTAAYSGKTLARAWTGGKPLKAYKPHHSALVSKATKTAFVPLHLLALRRSVNPPKPTNPTSLACLQLFDLPAAFHWLAFRRKKTLQNPPNPTKPPNRMQLQAKVPQSPPVPKLARSSRWAGVGVDTTPTPAQLARISGFGVAVSGASNCL